MSPDNERRILAALERLEAGQAQMMGRLGGQAQMREGMTRLEAGLAQLEAGQTQMRVDIIRRLDQLQETADAIRADIAAHGRTD